jgi:hypothetical protein
MALAVVLIAVSGMIPAAWRSAGSEAWRLRCQGNLMQVRSALKLYHDETGALLDPWGPEVSDEFRETACHVAALTCPACPEPNGGKYEIVSEALFKAALAQSVDFPCCWDSGGWHDSHRFVMWWSGKVSSMTGAELAEALKRVRNAVVDPAAGKEELGVPPND